MGIRKVLLIIPLFFLSSCLLLSKKEVKEIKGFEAPKVEIKLKKNLIILPFDNFSGKVEYDFIAENLPPMLFSYLKFMDKYPFSARMSKLSDEGKFFSFFGIKSGITPKIREYLVKRSFLEKDSKDILFSPAFGSLGKVELHKDKKLPKFFKLKVLAPKKHPARDLKKDSFFLKGEITKNQTLIIFIYDPVSDEKIFKWESPLPPINFRSLETNEDLSPLVFKSIKVFLEKMAGEDIFSLKLMSDEKDVIFYIDGNYVEKQSVLLTKGRHHIKAVKNGYYTYQSSFNLEKDSAFKVPLKKIYKTISLNVKAAPEKVSVFLDSKFIGFTPLKVKVEAGVHQLRFSRSGYHHANYHLVLRSFDKKKNLKVHLKPMGSGLVQYRETIRTTKNLAFYSFFPSLAAYIYCKGRSDFYEERVAADLNDSKSRKNYDFYFNAQQFFRSSTVFLLLTAAILQVLELEMDDVGIGVDQDKNLGVYFKW